jgi:hypothetical protein
MGRQVKNIQDADFGSLGLRKRGKITLTPPGGLELWMTEHEAQAAEKRWGWKMASDWDFWDVEGRGGCVWAGHQV